MPPLKSSKQTNKQTKKAIKNKQKQNKRKKKSNIPKSKEKLKKPNKQKCLSQANTYRTSHSILLSIERTITHENCLSPLPPTTRHFPPTFVVASLRLREVRSDGRLGSSPFLLPQPFARRCACANKRSVFRIFLLAEICHIFRWQVSHTQTRNTSWTLFFRKLSYGALVPLPLTRRKRKSKKEAKKNFNRIGKRRRNNTFDHALLFYFWNGRMADFKTRTKKEAPTNFRSRGKNKKKR